MKKRKLLKILTVLGWKMLRNNGKHDVWGDGEFQKGIPRRNEISEHTATAIIKYAKECNLLHKERKNLDDFNDQDV